MWPFGSSSTMGENYLRTASPNERRVIARESLDFYRALVVGGIYQFSEPVDTKSIFTYAHALRQCIDHHPQLSMTVFKADTDEPYFAFCPRLDLNQHIQFLEGGGESEIKTIERALPGILDAELLPPSIPAWKIIVLPFSRTRSFIGFSFSHAVGDGVSALAFHRTFLDALQEQSLVRDLICTPTRKQLRPAFDTAENLPISWAFLLAPLLGAYLPKHIGYLLGFRASASTITPSTWTATSIFYTPGTCRTAVQIISIHATTVEKTLNVCRKHGAKLTGLIHQLIVSALSESLPQPHNFDNFAAGTAIDMRSAVHVSKDEMGLFVSGDYEIHPLQKTNPETKVEFSWDLAKSVTSKLSVGAKELHDQPTGLLRYLSSIRAWTSAKLGQRRGGSYEVSNLASFRPLGSVKQCSVTEMIFCQPADVTSSALEFNIVSATDGPMNIAVNWQIGALGLGSGKKEVEFVNSICQIIERGFASLR